MKYRVWNETKKRYLNDSDGIPLIAPTGKINLFKDLNMVVHIEDELKVEEETSHSDNNDNIIHVGDIIYYNTFGFRFTTAVIPPLNKYHWHQELEDMLKNGNKCEVIGNINENKDLLDRKVD